jgi:hypothetical protein
LSLERAASHLDVVGRDVEDLRKLIGKRFERSQQSAAAARALTVTVRFPVRHDFDALSIGV